MGITLRDFFEYVGRHKAKLVVYRQLTMHLQTEFLSTDSKPPTSVLQLDDGKGAISEDVVEEVIQELYYLKIAPIQKKIIELMDTELDDKLNELRAEKQEERSDSPEVAPIRKKKGAKSK